MFYRQHKTLWYQFCHFKHFLKAENGEDSLASSCVEFSIGLSCNPVSSNSTSFLISLSLRKVSFNFQWNRRNFNKLIKKLSENRGVHRVWFNNWQKWKRVFLTRPCHKTYRDEAVGLKSYKYTWKITIFVKKCEIWGNIEKIWYFVNNYLIEARI